MTKTKLKKTLLELVLEFGFEQVGRTLREVRCSDQPVKHQERDSMRAYKTGTKDPGRKKPKVSAPAYVGKLKLDKDKETATLELAMRFERKDFLPTFGDIDYFCQFYGIDTPASRSRIGSIPRVFKYIASMDSGEIEKIVENRMFSGPSRLGPIADAIRRNGRARRASSDQG